MKKGCNLRFYFKSFRYSQDIDLDIRTVTKDKLRETVNTILSSKPFAQILEARGIRIERWPGPKQMETNQRWKLGLTTATTEIGLNTKFEFSRRGMKGNTLPTAPGGQRSIQAAWIPPDGKRPLLISWAGP